MREIFKQKLCSDCQKISALGPRSPDQELCPWTPLAAKPPDPYSSRYCARHVPLLLASGSISVLYAVIRLVGIR